MHAIRLVVGLGNPGKIYALTRHNVGYWLLDLWHKATQASAWENEAKFFAQYASFDLPNQTVCYLLKPTTYMNASGQAVAAFANFYKIPPEAILIIHDELDLPAGIAKFKQGGSDNGHNGLKSIIAQLGHANFWRLRLGIQPTDKPENMKNYVLGKPKHLEKKQLDQAIDRALSVLPLAMENFNKAMQILHSHASDTHSTTS